MPQIKRTVTETEQKRTMPQTAFMHINIYRHCSANVQLKVTGQGNQNPQAKVGHTQHALGLSERVKVNQR